MQNSNNKKQLFSPNSQESNQPNTTGVNINITNFGNEDFPSANKTPQIQKYNLHNVSLQHHKQLRWTKKDLVYEKLSQTHKPQYLQVARLLKEIEEKKKCTFKPEVNYQERRYDNLQQLFERLHREKSFKDQDNARREQIKISKEMQGCTFTPQRISVKRSQTNENKGSDQKIYDRLYRNFEEIERKKMRKKHEQELKINADLTFKPVLYQSYSNRNYHSSGGGSVFESLYMDSSKRAEKLQKKKEEKENTQRQSAKRRTNSLSGLADKSEPRNNNHSQPRYMSLYENFKELKVRKQELEKRVFKERGITFQPQSFRSSSVSRSVTSLKSHQQVQKDKQSNRTILNQKKNQKHLPPRPK